MPERTAVYGLSILRAAVAIPCHRSDVSSTIMGMKTTRSIISCSPFDIHWKLRFSHLSRLISHSGRSFEGDEGRRMWADNLHHAPG
ncbi:hypothetical protein EV361DRAFT_913806 [Lentinula raphanica]|nr:hypothetical protein EV361DRAFT_913806 [Lentinula raphanica]